MFKISQKTYPFRNCLKNLTKIIPPKVAENLSLKSCFQKLLKISHKNYHSKNCWKFFTKKSSLQQLLKISTKLIPLKIPENLSQKLSLQNLLKIAHTISPQKLRKSTAPQKALSSVPPNIQKSELLSKRNRNWSVCFAITKLRKVLNSEFINKMHNQLLFESPVHVKSTWVWTRKTKECRVTVNSILFAAHVLHQDTDDVHEAHACNDPDHPLFVAWGGSSNNTKSEHSTSKIPRCKKPSRETNKQKVTKHVNWKSSTR